MGARWGDGVKTRARNRVHEGAAADVSTSAGRCGGFHARLAPAKITRGKGSTRISTGAARCRTHYVRPTRNETTSASARIEVKLRTSPLEPTSDLRDTELGLRRGDHLLRSLGSLRRHVLFATPTRGSVSRACLGTPSRSRGTSAPLSAEMSRSALHFVLKRQMAAGAVPSADPFAETDAWQPDEERLAASAYTLCVGDLCVGALRLRGEGVRLSATPRQACAAYLTARARH